MLMEVVNILPCKKIPAVQYFTVLQVFFAGQIFCSSVHKKYYSSYSWV